MEYQTRIDNLTEEQKAQFGSYAQKWIDIGLKTGDADFDTFNKYMPLAYKKVGLEYPKNVVRVQSPLIGAIASSIAEGILRKRRKDDAVGGAVGDAVRDAVRDAVGDAVGGAVGDAVRDAVGDAVGGAVGDAVRDAVDDAVGGAVDDAVDDAVGGAVDDAVDDAVGGAVRDAVDDAVRDAVDDAVRGAVRGAVDDAVDDAVGGAVGGAVGDADTMMKSAIKVAIEYKNKLSINLEWHYWLGGQFWVGYWWRYGVAFVNYFFDVCGLKLSDDIMERAEINRKISESVNYIWANRDFVMVCDRPKEIHKNAEGRLHNINGMSISYKDGWGLYHLNGIRFNEDLYWKVVKGMPFEEILAIVDVDQRNQAMRFVGLEEKEKWLKHVKAEVVDEYKKISINGNEIIYKLYKIPQGDIFTEDTYIAYYTCPSTGLINFSAGDQSLRTIPEVMAWKMSSDENVISPEDWKLLVPLVDES